MTKPSNPPAFPNGPLVNMHGFQYQDAEPGMTLRDWFAGKAMQGMCANTSLDLPYDAMAGFAYKHADAMLTKREKHK